MLDFLGAFLKEIGSAGALALLVAAAIFYFYRRDHMQKQDHYREISERAVQVMARSAAAEEKMADALNRSAEVADKTADAYTKQIEVMFRDWSRRRPR